MEYLVVGRIINSHGVAGEVKVYPYTDDAKRFSNLKTAFIGEDKLRVNLRSVKYHKDLIIVKFAEFDNINQILTYKNELLYINVNDKVLLPDNHYYIFDLVGCSVKDLKGNTLGYISDILQYASNDVYVMKNVSDGKESLIPAVKEFIKDVNINDKIIIIDPIEGMIE